MRLLAILPELAPETRGGIGSYYGTLLPELIKRGCHVRAIIGSALWQPDHGRCFNGASIEPLERGRIAAFEEQFSCYTVYPRLRRHLAAAWAAWEQANRGSGYDIVETTDWGFLYIPWIARCEIPVNVQLHGSVGQIAWREARSPRSAEDHFVRLLELNALRAAVSLQTYGSSNKQEWESLLGRTVRCIHPPVLAVERQRLGENASEGIVVGRVQTWKGARELCAAMRLLRESAPSIKWIGRDTTTESGRSLIAELKEEFPDVWGRTLKHAGELAPEQVQGLLFGASFGIVPSTWDVFNLSAAEMMATGLIVLCSRAAGASELIRDGENGFLFDAGDADSLAAGIRRCLGLSLTERADIGTAARETVKARLDPSAIAEEHMASFEHLLGQSRGRDVELDAWTAEAVSPQPSSTPGLPFLDQLPLRKLAAYVAQRAVSKFSGCK